MEFTRSDNFSKQRIFDLPRFRNRTRIFHDRQEASDVLADLLPSWYIRCDPVMLAISSAGYMLATGIAERFELDVDFIPVQNVALPWDNDIDYAAVAFDGTVYLDKEMVEHTRLGQREIDKGIQRTLNMMKGEAMLVNLAFLQRIQNRHVLLVDEGITNATVSRAAIKALKAYHTKEVSIAAITASDRALTKMPLSLKNIFCANICSGYSYVADDAYRQPVCSLQVKSKVHHRVDVDQAILEG